jgi:SAM-dependent methyltransferase
MENNGPEQRQAQACYARVPDTAILQPAAANSEKKSSMNESDPGQWPEVALIWSQIGPPLRPDERDLEIITAFLHEHFTRVPTRPLSILILGVTPELYHLPWPDGSTVRAIDRTQAMIDHVWPGPRQAATHASWLDMPFKPSSMDLVLCDGGLHLLNYPQQQQDLVYRLAEIIKPDGYCAFRLFTPPVDKESVESVLTDLRTGAIPNLNHLKLRLGAALQEDSGRGVGLNEVWQTLHDAEPDLERLACTLGWESGHIHAIDAYKSNSARYYFVTADEALELFCGARAGAFEVCRIEYPDYPMGELCPTIIFRRR